LIYKICIIIAPVDGYRTSSPGGYFVSLHCSMMNHTNSSQRVHLDIDSGVGAVDYEELAKKEHLSGE
jgi:hypothetical protein